MRRGVRLEPLENLQKLILRGILAHISVNKTNQIARQVVRHVDCSHGRVRFESNRKARGLERKVPDGAADNTLGSGGKAVVRMAFYGIVIKVAIDEREVVRLDKVDLILRWARHAVGEAGCCERQ